MLLFRAMSENELQEFKSGKQLFSDKDFSTQYLDTTSFGFCFFKVADIYDEELLVKENDHTRYIDIEDALQLTGNYDTYKYGVYVEVDDVDVVLRHGSYQDGRSVYRISEYCTRKYDSTKMKLRRVVNL